MKIQVILDHKNRAPITVKPHTTVSTAAHRMKLEKVGSLIVSEDGKHPLGVVAVRDIVYGMAEHWGEDPKGDEFSYLQRPVSEIMTHHVTTCTPDNVLKEVMEMMFHGHYLHIPVVNDDRELVGIISIDDVIKYNVHELETETEILRERLLSHND